MRSMVLLQGRRLYCPSSVSPSLPLFRPLSTAHASVREGREEKERPWRHVQPADDINRFMRGGSGGKSGAMFDSYGRKHNYLRISLTERCNLRLVEIAPQNVIVHRFLSFSCAACLALLLAPCTHIASVYSSLFRIHIMAGVSTACQRRE